MVEEADTPGRAVAKEGQPVPESNLAADSKRGVRHPAQRNVPSLFSVSRMDEFGLSVPPLLRMLYCFPERTYCHSWSVLVTG